MPPQNSNNQGDGQPIITDNNPLIKRLAVLLIVLVAIGVASGGYFLMRKKVLPQQTPQTETPSSIGNNAVDGNGNGETKANNPSKYYKVASSTVYYQNQEVVGADTSTFQELADRWAKDKSYVYWEGQKQRYLDPATAKVFPSVYVIDKAGVWVYGTGYYMTVDKTDADPSTFSVISHGYGKDSKSIYYFAQKIANADVLSFTILRGANYPSSEMLVSSWYAKDKNSVYYRSSVIPNADVQSFVFLGSEYAKDKNEVYYEGKTLANADADSFALADGYAKDKNHIFYGDKILNIEIDPASFMVVGGGAIRDNKRVYFRDYYEDKYNLASGVDAPTFQYVGTCASAEKSSGSYFKDKNRIFIQNFSEGNPINPVNSIDVLSFQYLGDYGVAEGMPYSVSYAKDKNVVYHSCGKILVSADVSTFSDLKDGYAKDKNKVWYLADIISGADVATFQSLGEGYTKDRARAYFAGSVIEKADAGTFIVVKENITADEYGSVYAKDKNNVYSGTEVIEGANPENCTVESIKNCNPNP